MSRGQSHVVGIVLLLGLAMLSLTTITAGVGVVVDDTAAGADATRVATALDDAFRPTALAGTRTVPVPFADGDLHTESRTISVLDANGTAVYEARTNAVVFDAAGHGVTSLAGATLVRSGDWAQVRRGLPVTVGEDVLVVGAVRVRGDVAVAGTGGTGARLETTVAHERRALGPGDYRLAVETDHPEAFASYYAERNVTVTTRPGGGDAGRASVELDFPPTRHAYVVVHDVEVAT
ncbi:hypothetical protein GCM10009037_15740 [Halarchaeum grantii]|uniref:Type IV pilin n=1 Tax=Halarchaeum grantii TaxID=1193105 RepID=A0A830EV65_9EURY|nr:type IV pilin [Halarchaeum grantii]GGL32918.1 hypothetical protein GCM10009037_15740 [Halarchaeum grantii]